MDFLVTLADIVSDPIDLSLSRSCFIFLPILVCFCAFLPDEIETEASCFLILFSYLWEIPAVSRGEMSVGCVLFC